MTAAELYIPSRHDDRLAELPATLIPEDELVRYRVETLARNIGELMMRSEVVYNPAERDSGDLGYANLMQAIWFAAQDDSEARKLVEINAQTHIWECLMKAGVVFEVEMHLDSNGRLIQHRQWLEEVYENAFRWAANGPEMYERTKLETYNGLLGARWARLGLLKGQRIVVFSPYPTESTMTDERAREIGFFPATRSCAIQSLTMREDGTVVQEVAFVAGVAEEGGQRHDLAAIQALLADLGVDLDTSNASAVLGSPIAMSDSIQLVDLVQAYDRHASMIGTELFFGQAVPVQDYSAYIEQCRERLANLQPLVQATVDELLRQAGSLRSPADAVRALHDIAQRMMVDYALGDDSIDERVFGPEAVGYIQQARLALAQGVPENFLIARSKAQETAQTSSCPTDFLQTNETGGDTKRGSSSDDECDFVSRECPVCHARNVKTRVTRTQIIGSCGCKKKREAA